MNTQKQYLAIVAASLLVTNTLRAQELVDSVQSRATQGPLLPVPAGSESRPSPAVATGITGPTRLDGPQPEIHYPALAKRLGIQAKVTARVLIDETGKARKAVIFRREPFHIDLFDEAVRKNVMAARYAPPLKDGKPTAMWFDAPFNFVLDGSDKWMPRIVKLAEPVYPREGLEQGVEGWVSLLVELDEKGNTSAKQIKVLNRFPLSFPYFDLKATEAVLASTFEVPLAGFISRPSTILVRIDFKLPMN
jgi:TonB family protein